MSFFCLKMFMTALCKDRACASASGLRCTWHNTIATAQRNRCDTGWAPSYGCGRTWSGNGNGKIFAENIENVSNLENLSNLVDVSQKLDFNFNLLVSKPGIWNYRQNNIKQSNTNGPVGDSSAMEPVLMPENQKTNKNSCNFKHFWNLG